MALCRLVSVCFFLGTWNAGTTTPGDPYIAKWPDIFGNLKYRPVLRPDIISIFFKISNMIDSGNQLRQNELELERLWLTKDPWFRIICTIFGVTVTDAFRAVKHQAPECAQMDNITIKDFAAHVVYDLWNWKHAEQPSVEIEPDVEPARSSHTSGSACQAFHPVTLFDVIEKHDIRRTAQRSGKGNNGKGQPVRRRCQIRAEGCHGMCTSECHHQSCLNRETQANNRWNKIGPQQGLFVCLNPGCKRKHWDDILSSHQNL